MGVTPLYLEVEGKNVFILGTGEVATRRANRFLDKGANVVLVGENINSELLEKGAILKPSQNLEALVEWSDFVILASGDWYGIKGDTFHIREKLIELGTEELLTIGDQDRAIEIQKAILLEDHTLSEVVEFQKNHLNIKAKIIPMSDEDSDIKINTKEHGEIEFHEFLIKYGGEPEVLEVIYSDVNPSPELIETIEKSDKVIIGPSNPITSIRPITSIKGVEEALKGKEVIAVSPFVGNDAFSGPAGKFMTAFGYETSSKGVAELYKAFLNTLVIDNQDAQMKGDLEEIVPEVIVTNTFMNSIEDKINLAKVVLNME